MATKKQIKAKTTKAKTAKAKTTKAKTTKAETAKAKTTKAETAKAKTTKAETAKAKTTKAKTAKAKDTKKEITVEDRLIALYTLQQIDKQIDKIRVVRGELPLEIEGLGDEVKGLETRVTNYVNEIAEHKSEIEKKHTQIEDSKTMIKKYEDQQMNVRNNREFDSLTKEINYQNLEIELFEKRIDEHKLSFEAKDKEVEEAKILLDERTGDFQLKKSELDGIIAETEKDKKKLISKSDATKKLIEERLLTAYQRIRDNARNGLSVVQVERDACGGCFSKIPPQMQLDIRTHRKIIVCEYCGRILIDNEISEAVKI